MADSEKPAKATIIVAIIGAVGVILAAFITQYPNIFPRAERISKGAASTPVAQSALAGCDSQELQAQQLGGTSAAIMKSAEHMKTYLLDSKLECVETIARSLLQIDQYNGHGLYFMGEVWNKRSKRDALHASLYRERMRENFSVYIDTESALPSTERDGIGAFCYRREKGYCAERTAWISHLMAIDFYEQAQAAPNKRIKVDLLQRAQKFIKTDLAFGGFAQIVPSKVLDGNIQESVREAARD